MKPQNNQRNQRTVRLLLVLALRQPTARELTRMSRLCFGTVREDLRWMTDAGLVTRRRVASRGGPYRFTLPENCTP